MIDTIIMILPMRSFTITHPANFQPNSDVFFRYPSYQRAVNNPRRTRRSEYYPRMTLYRRPSDLGTVIELRIEFSAPKIIFGNNLDEVENEHYSRILELLHVKLCDMGVYIDHDTLANAPVSSFHPSINILLSGFWTATGVIRELNKIVIPKTFDLDHKEYNNNGHCLQYYTASHAFVFYDKINDMGKPAKRAIDKEITGIQTNLFNSIQQIKRERTGNPIEILRTEVRLSKKRKMNKILKLLGHPKNPTFKEVYNKGLCQNILKLYWQEMVLNRNSSLLTYIDNPQRNLDNLLRNNPSGSLNKAIYKAGIIALAKSEEGMRGFRQIVESFKCKRTWSRKEKEVKEISRELNSKDCYEFVKDISNGIEEFKPFRSSILQNLTVKNCKV